MEDTMTRYYIAGNPKVIRLVDSKFKRCAGDVLNFNGERLTVLPHPSGETMEWENKSYAGAYFHMWESHIITTFWEIHNGTFSQPITEAIPR